MRRPADIAVLIAPIALLAVPFLASQAGAEDRFGPARQDDPSDAAQAPVAFLTWPGKQAVAVAPAAPQGRTASMAPSPALGATRQAAVVASYPVWTSTRSSAPAPTPRLVVPQPPIAAEPEWQPVPMAPAAASAKGPAPAQQAAMAPLPVYPAPASAAPASAPTPPQAAQPSQGQVASAGTSGLPPRFYSVGRQYGVQPDPIPLSPQFLADSAGSDLAAPPPPLPQRLTAAQSASLSTGAATYRNRDATDPSSNDQ